MADTIRTRSALQGLFADNTSGDVSPQDLRDFLVSTPIISSEVGAPGSTPATIGDMYYDTTNKQWYIATGTSTSADWRRLSYGWELFSSWTWSTNVAQVDFTGLGVNYSDLKVIVQGVTVSSAGFLQFLASVDNGSSYANSGTDYQSIAVSGGESGASSTIFHTSSTAGPVTGIMDCPAAGVSGVPHILHNYNSAINVRFNPSNNPINAFRVNVHNGANLTAGKIYVLRR